MQIDANHFNPINSNIQNLQNNQSKKLNSPDTKESEQIDASKSLLLNNEQELSSLEQAKKSIIEQVLHKMLGNGNNNNAMPLYPSVAYETNNVMQEQSAQYNQESYSKVPEGFLYESVDEFYQKTTIDFSASATINTPNGKYEIEINFQYTQEIYERHSTAITSQQDYLKQNPLSVSLDNDDYSLKDLKHIDLVFDAKKAEELEEEQQKNAQLLKFLQSLFQNKDKENASLNMNNKEQNDFFAQVSVYEQQDQSYQLAAQTQNGVGMYFSHEKSEASFANATYDSNGNFSFSAGYSSYESTEFAITV